jgi:hypothetical protein
LGKRRRLQSPCGAGHFIPDELNFSVAYDVAAAVAATQKQTISFISGLSSFSHQGQTV